MQNSQILSQKESNPPLQKEPGGHFDSAEMAAFVGVVAIGRNEGERLKKCLESISRAGCRAVYVDSGSTDDSVTMARNSGAEVVQLDMRIPFTAARARNAGFRRLMELAPELPHVQFVDGDCEITQGWISRAAAFLGQHADIAAVGGRRRERYPERSVYNLLCDIDWEAPAGEARFCGGDAMMRTDAVAAIGGYREDMIAGEDPELYVRLRQAGWRLWRLDAEMTLHDAAMTRFWQWWKRTVRTGYAYAQGAHLHGAPPERYGRRELRSVMLWALAIPVAILTVATISPATAAIMLLAYPVQVARLAVRGRRSARENWWYAVFLVLGKLPQLLGQAYFNFNRIRGTAAGIIEYK